MGHRSSLTLLQTEDKNEPRCKPALPPTEVIHHDCYDVRPGAGLGAEQPSQQDGNEDQVENHLTSQSQVSLISPVKTILLPDLAQSSEAMND